MVTEILRPLEGSMAGFGSIAGSACEVYPESTADTDVYKLVNEAIADDDATYIKVKSASMMADGMFHGLFNSEIFLHNYSKMTLCLLHFRGKADTTDCMFGFGDTLEIAANSTEWEDYCVELDVELIKSELEENIPETGFLLLMGGVATNNSAKNKYVYFTQVYLEVTYSDVDEPDNPPATTETIYLKENGAWTTVSCTIYQKQNGAWALTDSTVFNNGDNFILQQTT